VCGDVQYFRKINYIFNTTLPPEREKERERKRERERLL
jgi:hypothetical protein